MGNVYSSPPPAREPHQNKPTLLVCWWATLFAATIIWVRIAGRYIRSERLFKEDWISMACLVPLFARMAFVHVVLLWGTNNTVTTGFTEEEIENREYGSRFVLASRVFYAATLWMLKLTITEFLKRMTLSIWRKSYETTLQVFRYSLLATFIAVLLSDLLECTPFTHYWQVVPDPGGKCRQGFVQLITMGTVNVVTDIFLILFPIPIIIRSSMPSRQKAQLIFLFGLSVFPVIITLYRVPAVIHKHGSQQYRSLWASIEIALATAVANALVLGSFIRDKGVKKVRWRATSLSETVERKFSRRGTVARQWGSDEDLVRDIGLGVDPKLRGETNFTPRPAPKASQEDDEAELFGGPLDRRASIIDEEWQFEFHPATSSEIRTPSSAGPDSQISLGPRKVSFFDVGGLLDDENSKRVSNGTMSTSMSLYGPGTSQPADLPVMPSPWPEPRPSQIYRPELRTIINESAKSGSELGSTEQEGLELHQMSKGRSWLGKGKGKGYTPPPQGLLELETIPNLQFKDVGGFLR